VFIRVHPWFRSFRDGTGDDVRCAELLRPRRMAPASFAAVIL
jgi:hypothetical protein